MILNPEQYSSASVYDLVSEAARGYVPLDHRFVRDLLDRGEAVFPDFIRFFKEKREDDRFEMAGVMSDIARQLHTSAALPFFAEYARSYDFEFTDALTEAFVELGPDSVDTLLELHRESNGAPDVLFALAGLGVHDDRILAVLLEHLKVDPEDASIALGLYADPAAKPALERAIAEAGDNQRLKDELESAIAEIDRADETRPEPFDIWPLYPARDDPYFAAFDTGELLEFLNSPVGEYRARAVTMLAYEEPPVEISRRIFELAKTDPDAHVRAASWEALEAVHEPPEIEPALRRVVEDVNAPLEERAGALVGLAHEARDDERLRERIIEFYANPETRAQAVKAMWHSGDRRFEGRIPAALDDPNIAVRRQAITAAGMFSMVAQVGRIESSFDDEELRKTALYAYALAAPSEVTPARMKRLFHRIEELAGGLSEEESAIVGKALDERLEAYDYDPVFIGEEAWEEEDETEESDPVPAEAPKAKVGRNDPCPCGSGKKYKKCCGK